MSERAARVRTIAKGNFGSVLSCDDETMLIEVPADIAPGLTSIRGMGGFVPSLSNTRLAPRRVVNNEGMTVMCDDMVTTPLYRYRVNLG
jgi:hypothetical protein